MKATLLIFLHFFLIPTSFAQTKQFFSERQDTLRLFCQHWVLTTMAAQGKSASVPAAKAMYVTYKTDGSYTDSSARFGVSQGTWMYESETKLLYLDGKSDKTKTRVVKLTSSELVMETAYPAVTMTTTYRRID